MMKHLSTLTGLQNPSLKLITQYWSITNPKSMSINVDTDKVYNIMEGYSLDVIENQTAKGVRYIVNMKISNELIVRYTNLKELYLPSRSAVDAGFLIGKADKCVSIECCTRAPSPYPVRIGDQTYYNEDPKSFLIDDYEPPLHIRTFYTVMGQHFEVFGDN